MNLEVKGSNPFIHPILTNSQKILHHDEFWEFFTEAFSNKFQKKIFYTKTLKLNYYYNLRLLMTKSRLLSNLKPKHLCTHGSSNNFSIKYFFQKNSHLNLNFKFKNNIHSIDHTCAFENAENKNNLIKYESNSNMLKTFISFLIINSETTQPYLIPNSDSQAFYFSNSKGGSKIINISKLFKKWLDFYNLLFNIFYYKIKLLNFAPASHMKEITSLNWEDFTQNEKLWRYAKPFLFNKPNTINDEGDFTFHKLRLKGWGCSIVSDIIYHAKTLIYLRRSGFFTVASLPSMYNDSSIDFFLPSNTDTSLTLSYFLRTILKIKNEASHSYTLFLSNKRL